jgi:hypothetical protein
MICKKEFDNEHKTITLSFFNHNKCVSWIMFEIVDDEFVFDKEIKNCFFADAFITLSNFKEKYYQKNIEMIKKLNSKIVIDFSNKKDKKHIPYFIKNGFKKVKENYYEFKRDN